ncbi:MAG: hypothetical protein NTV93_21020 [Verrucomicrobia bacterium]|nr:hypothetical protein [Verrucomicrobiota bacterium]
MTTIELLHAGEPCGWSGLAPLATGLDATFLASKLVVDKCETDFVIAHAEITNTGSDPVRIKGIRWTNPGRSEHTLKFAQEHDPHYFSTENYRADYFGTGTCIGDAFSAPLPNATVELGWSEDEAFPGLFVGAVEKPLGLFCAAMTQQTFHLLFRLRGRNHKGEWFFEIDEYHSLPDGLLIQPGETLRGENLFFGLCRTNNPQQASVEYEKQLESRGVYERRKLNPLADQRIWCSWNYDFFANITEGDVMRQIPIIRENFPNVKFIQLDDGYQKEIVPGARAMIDLVYDGVDPFDPVKFPCGAKGLADQIKAEGFRPAIWLGLWASKVSRMVQENPDWVLKDEMGRPMIFDAWYGGTCVLDASLVEVQEYFEHVAETVFGKWGYEGVKLDFSSFAFEGKRNLLRGPLTPLEAKNRLLASFRKYLPKDGFFGWCVVCGTGHPLVGLEADYFRNAEDIGKGNWDLARRIALWTLNTNLLMRRRPVFPNIDSVGWSPDFDDTAWQSWLNLCAISGAAIEISGDLAKLPPERIQRMAKTMELSDPHRLLTCPDFQRGRVHQPPAFWVAEGPSDRLLAIFNWKDEPATLACPLTQSGAKVVDVWTGKPVANPQAITLAAHESVLWRLPG